jgi:hypothetical protein
MYPLATSVSPKYNDNMENDNYSKMHSLSENVRGRIINMATFIEIMLSKFITYYFSKEEHRESFRQYFMSDSMTFEKKKSIFSSLNKKKLLEEFNPYENINDDLQYLQNIRNLIAHSVLLTTDESISSFDNSNLKFVSFTFKDGSKEICYNLIEESEDPKKLIFSDKGLTDRVNNLYSWFSKWDNENNNN